jgi:hypothetical protein
MTDFAGRIAVVTGGGKDAHQIDELVRQSPERTYDLDFFAEFVARAGWRVP